MDAMTSKSRGSGSRKRSLEQALGWKGGKRPLEHALDFSEQATGPAEEAWALMARLLFVHGKPRFPAIAAELDLHPSQAVVLRLLAEPRSMGVLAGAMHCDNSNVTGIVDRLEERGLARRQPAEHDRRVKLIAATPSGSEMRDELNRRLAEPPEPIKRLSAADQRALRDLLRRAIEDEN